MDKHSWRLFINTLSEVIPGPIVFFDSGFKVVSFKTDVQPLAPEWQKIQPQYYLPEVVPFLVDHWVSLSGNASQVLFQSDQAYNFTFVKKDPETRELLGGFLHWKQPANTRWRPTEAEATGKLVIDEIFEAASPDDAVGTIHQEALLAVWLTQVEERRRISEKIHNSLGQILYGFKMEFSKAIPFLEPGLQDSLLNILSEAIQETKNIAFELMPAMLEDFGLPATLAEFVAKHNSQGLDLTCQIFGLTGRLDLNQEILIFNVIQELMNNLIKHAQATKAKISIERVEEMIRIKIIDNGVGFERETAVFSRKGTGLRHIKNSLKFFGGIMKISSQLGKGTLVTVEVPIRNPNPILTGN